MNAERRWIRRAQPLLGTVFEIGSADDDPASSAAVAAAFAMARQLQACLSRFEPASDIARFNALAAGASMSACVATLEVLAAAFSLCEATDGAFDITLGSGARGWRVDGAWLAKLSPGVRLDLGGIAKGYIVDRAVQTLLDHGSTAGWANAGGDLRSFGGADVPVLLRDERNGGVRPFATLRDGAFATSRFDRHGRATLTGWRPARPAHVSVAAPLCLWADALTKVVALTGTTSHPLLARHHATAWRH